MLLYPLSDPRSFAIPIAVSLSILLLMLVLLSTHWMNTEKPSVKTVPSHIAARVVHLDKPKPAQPKPKKQNVKKNVAKPVEKPKVKPNVEPKVDTKKAPPVVKPSEKAAALQAQKQAEKEKREQEKLKELARQAALNELDSLLSDELAELEANQAQEDAKTAEVVADYASQIRALIERVWRVPPSAKHTDTLLLRIFLVPTGEVTEVHVVESSGNTALDRSAEQAVWKVAVFPVPKDPAVFEKEFRRFNLKLTPENARL